ncbi:MAG TPA: hypothetical protein PK158_10625, partial [Spirochaetota bacterium]|nr:hypothetical protein [Spirochaetota bacterium]
IIERIPFTFHDTIFISLPSSIKYSAQTSSSGNKKNIDSVFLEKYHEENIRNGDTYRKLKRKKNE